MKKVSIIILLFTYISFNAQIKKEIDSLETLLKNTKDETIKIHIFSKLSDIYYLYDRSKSDYYKKQLKDLSHNLKSDLGFTTLYLDEGFHYASNNQIQQSILSYKKALFFAKRGKLDIAMASCYNNFGVLEKLNSNYKISIANYIECMKIYERKKMPKYVYLQLIQMIDLYVILKDIPNAQRFILKASSIMVNLKENYKFHLFYECLGKFHKLKKNYILAIKYFKKSIYTYKKYANLENTYVYSDLALTYMEIKDYKNAKLYLSKYAKFMPKDPEFEVIAGYYQALTQYYIETKDYTKAKETNTKAKIIFEKSSNEMGILNIYQNKVKIAVAQKEYQDAYNYNLKANEIEKKIANKEIKLAIAEIDIKYETLKKEKLLLKNKAEAKTRNILLVAITVLVIFLITFGYLIFRKQKLEIKQKRKENELQEALSKIEIQNKLQEQRLHISRDLHDNIGSQLTFIASSVENIKYSFDNNNPNLNVKIESISNFAKDTILELRETIWAMNNNDMSFEDLQTKIKILINKAKEIHPKIIFDPQFDDSLKEKKFKSLEIINTYRCIQEALNNALKHAKASQIHIKTAQIQEYVQIVIQDNGQGFDLDENEDGNGLANMEKRITDIGGTFKILSSSEGTQITILI